MKTCFVVHDREAAKALRDCVGPNHVVATPGASLAGFAIDRLVILDGFRDCDTHLDMLKAEAWLREIVMTRLTRGAQTINVPQWAKS